MGYQYRKKKRKLAHHILATLYQDILTEWISKNEYDEPRFQEYYQIIRAKTSDPGFTSVIFDLLKKNEHIYRHPTYTDTLLIRISPAGIDAYKSEYYLVENRKDLLESFEVRSKWIIPLISLAISIIAFFISFFRK